MQSQTLVGTAPEQGSLGWRSAAWFNLLAQEQKQQVERDMVVRHYAAGSTVVALGSPADFWIGVQHGLVKLCKETPQGRTATLAGVPAGGWFGEGSLLKDEARLFQAVALRDSSLALLPRTSFQRLLDDSIAFNRYLLHQLNERLGQFIATVESDRLQQPEVRVARSLALMYNPKLYPATPSSLELSQEEIGNLSGMSRQRTNQALQELSRAGLLKMEYGSVTILDLQSLMHFGVE